MSTPLGIQTSVLPRFRILQLGDLHYPEWEQISAPLDIKTTEIDQAIIDALVTGGLQNILRFLSDRRLLETCDAIILMGDLTSRGDRLGLEQVIAQLAHLLGAKLGISKPVLCAVPGNHDVNREVALSTDMSRKFDELDGWLQNRGFRPIPKVHPVTVPSEDPARPVQLNLLNTTLGSWERMGLPQKVVETIDRLLAEQGDEGTGASTVPIQNPTEYYDQLDMPFVSASSLATLKSSISEDGGSLPVIVGHHNLFPQAIPRVAPFAELLNQGDLREAMLSLRRSVIYLHGHTHDDPILVCTSPEHPNSQIICISAPRIDAGLNVIDIYFDRSGEGLGVSITPVRPDARNLPQALPERAVSLGSATVGVLRSDLARNVYKALSDQGRLNWQSLRGHVGINEAPEDDLEATILELKWGMLLRIMNPGAPRQRWILEVTK